MRYAINIFSTCIHVMIIRYSVRFHTFNWDNLNLRENVSNSEQMRSSGVRVMSGYERCLWKLTNLTFSNGLQLGSLSSDDFREEEHEYPRYTLRKKKCIESLRREKFRLGCRLDG